MTSWQRDLLRGPLLWASIIAFFSFSVFTTFAFAERGADRRPSVAILGSGERPSVLISYKGARILIAAGDDPAALGNALRDARSVANNRIDVLVLIGDARDATFLSRAIDAADARSVDVVGGPDLIGLLDLPPDVRIASARRYRIGDSVTVTVESRSSTDWRAIATIDQATFAIYPSSSAVEAFPVPGDTDALIVGGRDPESAVAGQDAIQLVGIGGGAIDGRSARNQIATVIDRPIYAIRVADGAAARIEIVDGGLSLPREAVLVPPSSD